MKGELRPFGKIMTSCLGKMLDKEKNQGTPRQYLRNINVRWFGFDLSDLQTMRIADDEIDRYSIRKGDLVVCEGGEPGRCAIWCDEETVCFQKALHRIRFDETCDPKYYMYLLWMLAKSGALAKYYTGTGIKHLTGESLRKLPVPVPPLPEQKRIVARIEELFSELDNGVETLKKTKQQLAVYRQSVLKAAFESAVECSEKLMTIEDLLVSDRKGMATGPFGTLIKKHEHRREGIPMLGIENIGEGKFIDGNKIFVTAEKAKELQSFALKAGDIIISRSGTVGEICSVPARMEGALLSTNLMRVSLNQKKVLPEYFIYMFQSKGIVLDQVKELCKGSTRIFLNQAILKQIHFPMPSIKTQSEILDEIESKMSVCDNIEKTIDATLRQTESLRQSILKKAFEGEL